MWLEAHQELPQHPKTKRLARILGISIRETVGSLYMFWGWAMEYAKDGDLSDYEATVIADAVQWEGDPDTFLNAMIDCGPGSKSGFIDRTENGLFIHDWDQYVGKNLKKLEKTRERIEKIRAEKKEERTVRDMYAEKESTESVQYSECTRTVPSNITEHNITKQDITDMTQHDITAKTPPTHHPADAVSLNEVIEAWNQILAPQGFPSILKRTPAREKALNARINVLAERKKIEWWQSLFTRIASSDFLKNSAKDKTWFSFEWVLNENNLVKVLEGKYDNRVTPAQPPIRSFDEILARHRNNGAIDAEFEVKSDD